MVDVFVEFIGFDSLTDLDGMAIIVSTIRKSVINEIIK
jgi:hypothetical protein